MKKPDLAKGSVMDEIRPIFNVEVQRHLPYFLYVGNSVKFQPCTLYAISRLHAIFNRPLIVWLQRDAVYKR